MASNKFNLNTNMAKVQIDNSENSLYPYSSGNSNAVYLYGNRRNLNSGETSLPLPNPTNGETQRYDYYNLYKLPNKCVSDPDVLLQYFKSLGYGVGYGNSGNLTLSDIVAIEPINKTTAKLYFAGQSYNVTPLFGNNLQADFDISNGGTHITGTIEKVIKETITQDVVVALVGVATSGSPTITNVTGVNINLLTVNAVINSTYFPAGTTILSVNATSKTITVSQNATGGSASSTLFTTIQSDVTSDVTVIANSSNWGFIPALTSEDVVVSYTTNSAVPDSSVTEPFIMNLWHGVFSGNTYSDDNSVITTSNPQVYFSILPDEANTDIYSPLGKVMGFGVAPTTVTINSDGTVTLVVPTTANWLSFVPFTTFGNTTISQVTSNASANIFESHVSGNTFIIILNNITGTFNTTNNISLVLDNTIDLQKLLNKLCIGLNTTTITTSFKATMIDDDITTNDDLNDTHIKMTQYVNDNAGINAPQMAYYGQSCVALCFANSSLSESSVTSSLTTNTNKETWTLAYMKYIQRIGVRSITSGNIASALAFLEASNNYPFNPVNSIVLGSLDNSSVLSDNIDMQPDGTLDQLLNLGITPLYTNEQGKVEIFKMRNTLTLINGQTNNEFDGSYYRQGKSYVAINIANFCRQLNIGKVKITTNLISDLTVLIKGFIDGASQKNGGFIYDSSYVNSSLSIVIPNGTNNSANIVNPKALYISMNLNQTTAWEFCYGEIVNQSILNNVQ